MNIQAMSAQRQRIYEFFKVVVSDEEGDAATMELAQLNQAILAVPVTSPADLIIKLGVWGDILSDYGDWMVDGQTALWERLAAEVASFVTEPLAKAA